MMQRGFAPILIIIGILIIVSIVGGAYYLGTRKPTTVVPSPTPTVTSQTPQSTFIPSPVPQKSCKSDKDCNIGYKCKIETCAAPMIVCPSNAEPDCGKSVCSGYCIDETANWKIYTNLKYKFAVKYPTDWKYIEVPNSTYKFPAGKDGIWFLPQFASLPALYTEDLPPISLWLSTTDPFINPKDIDNYKSVPYKSGTLQGQLITGTTLAGFPINSIIIKMDNFYIQAEVSNNQYNIILDQILSTFRFD